MAKHTFYHCHERNTYKQYHIPNSNDDINRLYLYNQGVPREQIAHADGMITYNENEKQWECTKCDKTWPAPKKSAAIVHKNTHKTTVGKIIDLTQQMSDKLTYTQLYAP